MVAGLSSMNGLIQLGARYFLLAFFDTKTKLEYMKRFDPKAMLTVPAYLTTLTETAKELGYDFKRDFPSMEALVIAAGAYPLSWAREMEDTWDAAISEQYGSSQMGSGAIITCETGVQNDQGGRHLMHILEFFVYAEVINRETGEQVEPGEEGELVITPLGRQASPLIRFATSDRVRYRHYEECSCGRPLMGVECGTIERYDDMVKMKGTNVWPAAIDSVVFEHQEVFDYRGRVFMSKKGKETVEMNVEFKKNIPEKEKTHCLETIEKSVQEKVGIRMDVREASPETIERIQFKGKRWIDERIRGLERKTI
jgi:phenylacetate-CoA ligase